MAESADASSLSGIYIPRPEKFAGQCGIEIWFKQFELFLTLSKVPDDQRANILLSYLDLDILVSDYWNSRYTVCIYPYFP